MNTSLDMDKIVTCKQRVMDHIRRVQYFYSRMVSAGVIPPEMIDKFRIKMHDADKLEPDNLKKQALRMCDGNLTQEDMDKIGEVIRNHTKQNPHHCEYWCDGDPNVQGASVVRMEDTFIYEMCADWAATAEEKGTSLMDWVVATVNKRWTFSQHQVDIIYRCCRFLQTIIDPSLKRNYGYNYLSPAAPAKMEAVGGNSMKIDWSGFDDPVIQKGVSLMKQINDHGYDAYVVGGCVRDIVNGSKDVHDVDIATNMPIDQLQSNFKTGDNGGEKHGTILVFNEGEPFEVTQFRTEQGYSDGRHPDSVTWTNSFEEDTKRRDFTINAMGIDASGNVIDYNGGVDDLHNKVLRTVGNAEDRFGEDALRIIRAMRFAARFDMNIAEDTLAGIIKCRNKLSNIAMDRIYAELVKTAEYGSFQFASVVKLLDETGCGDVIDPNGLINWAEASELTENRALHVKGNELDKDVVVSLALLFYGASNLKKAMQYFRCTADQIKSVNYIFQNLRNYRKLGDVDPFGAINIVKHPDFERLRLVYQSIEDGKDSDDADVIPTVRMLIQNALPRFGDISNFMVDMGIKTGPDFGVILRNTADAMCNMYISGEEPTDDQLKEIIKNFAG